MRLGTPPDPSSRADDAEDGDDNAPKVPDMLEDYFEMPMTERFDEYESHVDAAVGRLRDLLKDGTVSLQVRVIAVWSFAKCGSRGALPG